MTDTGTADANVHSSNDASTGSGSFAKHCFPLDGIAAMSQIAYHNTLSTEKIDQGVFVIRGA